MHPSTWKKIGLIALFLTLLHFTGRGQALIDTSHASARLKQLTGEWKVDTRIQAWPGDQPVEIKDLKASRLMVGDYCLHEIMVPVNKNNAGYFERLSDLAFNVNEQRWDYSSIDTRITGGIMYFMYLQSRADTIISQITSIPHPGIAPDLKGRGQSIHIRNEFIFISGNHTKVNQYWRLTDKQEWLAISYDYTRQH